MRKGGKLMKNYVIVGNGVAAVGCIEGIRSVDSTGAITIVSEENSPAYCRPLISYYLEKKTTLEKMPYRPADFYEKNGCTVLYGQKAEKIDADTQTVLLSGGAALPYTSVCVATGSSPFVPPFAGLERVKNKFSFMTVEDTLALEKALSPNANVFIVGAGLIGLKCAEGIAKRVKSVTVCDLADRVLSSILDGECAALMQTRLEENGIAFMLGDTAVAFTENSATMKSGKKVEFDILVLAVGVRANTSLVKEAGGEVNRGIVVDTSMKTSLPSVYAAGDCTEGYDLSLGARRVLAILPNAYMQGFTAGVNMAGGKKAFDNAIPMNSIGFFGLHAMTAGTYEGTMVEEKTENSLKRFFIKDGRLSGFILIGHCERVGILTSLIREKTPLSSVDFDLLTKVSTSLAFNPEVRKKKFGATV